MFITTRRPGERLVLPELGVVICIVGTKKNAARVGVEAPPEVKVVREELLREPPAGTPRLTLPPA